MTVKFERPAGAYSGAGGLANRTKYQDDAVAVPKTAISSAKVDGDFNYVVDALNSIDEARGSRASIAERLDVIHNADGTLKASVTASLDDWITLQHAGALARVSDNSITVGGGDYTGVLQVGRRFRFVVGGSPCYADIAASSHAGGTTTLVLANIVNSSGAAAVVGAAPSAIAYGPLLPGIAGNGPQVMDALTVGGYRFYKSGADLKIDPAGGGTGVTITSGGLKRIADGEVGMADLATAVVGKLCPTGCVMPFAGATAPTGWLVCAGQEVSRATYGELFAKIGTAYGAGDGSTTFNIPDLRGRTVFGLDNSGGTPQGRMTGLHSLGQTGGSEYANGTTEGHALTTDQIPAHTHEVYRGNSPGSTNVFQYGGAGSTDPWTQTQSTGGGQAHSHDISNLSVRPPFMGMVYIIRT